MDRATRMINLIKDLNIPVNVYGSLSGGLAAGLSIYLLGGRKVCNITLMPQSSALKAGIIGTSTWFTASIIGEIIELFLINMSEEKQKKYSIAKIAPLLISLIIPPIFYRKTSLMTGIFISVISFISGWVMYNLEFMHKPLCLAYGCRFK